MDPVLRAFVFSTVCMAGCIFLVVFGVTGLFGAHPDVAVVGGIGVALGVHAMVRTWRFRASQRQQTRAPDNDPSADA